MSGDIQFGLKVSYDGKSVAGGAAANAAQIKAIGTTAEAAGAQASRALDRTAMSAKQTAFALRQVPMQFTDIFTSLAAGQNPMQVMLQQGGQLKDTFGGIAPAARALGGYIMGLVNPFTIAAAAAAGLAYVYHQGAQESDAYTRALILSGNAAGTTAAQMADAARRVATATGGTQGAAAEALALGAAGGVPGAALAGVAEAAVRMQQVTGRAIDDTVAEFAKLARDPVAASAKLNEQYNYLAEATYRQIKAFEEQGRHTDAVALAMNAYAEAVAGRTGEITANLGLIEGKWLGLKAVTKGALDALFDIGRPGDALEAAVGKVQDIQARMRDVKKNAAYDPGTARAELVLLEQQLVTARAHMVVVRDKANADAVAARAAGEQAAKTKAAFEFDKDGLKFLSRKKQMEKEIDDQRALGIAAGRSEEEIQKRIAAIREKYTEKKTTTRDGLDDAARAQAQSYAQQYEAAVKLARGVELEGAAQEKLLPVARALAEARATLSDAQAREIEQAMAGALLVEQRTKAEKDAAEQGKIYAAAIRAQIAPLEERMRHLAEERQNAGKTEAEINAIAIARLEEARAIAAANGALEQHLDFYDREIAARQGLSDELAKQKAAQEDWLTAARTANRDYVLSTEDAAGQTKRAWSGTWKHAEDELTNFFTTGKFNVRSFVSYTINELARIQLAQPAVKALSGAADNWLGSLFGSSGSGTAYAQSAAASDAMTSLWSYAGGGYTGDGARTGGLDGQGGFLAMMHPQESVTDHAQGGSADAGGGVILNYSPVFEIDARGAGVGVGPMLQGVVEAAVQRSKAELMADLSAGGQFAYATGRRRS